MVPCELSDTEKALLRHLTVGEDKINLLESDTRDQAGCDDWKTHHTYRFTVPSFQLIASRQRNHENFT